MMDYDGRSSEKRLAAAENDWLAAPENAELLEVYTCSLCGNPIFEGDEYLAVDCCGEVCSECLEGLTAKDFALAALVRAASVSTKVVQSSWSTLIERYSRSPSRVCATYGVPSSLSAKNDM